MTEDKPSGSRGARGTDHPNSKLDWPTVKRIRENAEGWNDHRWARELAAEGIRTDRSNIRLIRLNAQWHDPEYTPGPPVQGRGRPPKVHEDEAGDE